MMLQVLIVLRTLLLPGKVPAEGLKPKQRMEAQDMEKQVTACTEINATACVCDRQSLPFAAKSSACRHWTWSNSCARLFRAAALQE
jgi:hypothetical protein